MKTFLKLSRKYKTPKQVQKFLRNLNYNHEEKGETCRSALNALKKKQCHCLEAAFLAAAILEHIGYPPLVLSLESKDNLDHVVFVFKEKSGWGSIARSRDENLNGRAPTYKTIRDLVWSYYDAYIDKTGKITAYQVVNLDESKSDWRYSKKNVWKAENFLIKLKHIPLKSSSKRYKKIHASFHSHGPLKKLKSWW